MGGDAIVHGVLKAARTKAADGKVFVDVVLRCELSNSALRLIPRVEQGFTVRFQPDQAELTGLDVALNLVRDQG